MGRPSSIAFKISATSAGIRCIGSPFRNCGLTCLEIFAFAAAFGVAAVLLHDRARRQGSLPARVLAPLMLALALMSGEAGVSGFAYLFAYAVAFDPAPLRARALSLVPFLPVLVAWRVMSRSLDFGVHGSGFYVDPAEAPLQFLATFPGRLLANFRLVKSCG